MSCIIFDDKREVDRCMRSAQNVVPAVSEDCKALPATCKSKVKVICVKAIKTIENITEQNCKEFLTLL